MLLRELFEQNGKLAVIGFGRLNPPTTGHAELVKKIKSINGDHFLFLSHTQKPKTDPLDFQTKLKYAKQFFPDINIGHPAVKTPVLALEYLQGQGYTDVIFVAGSDRVEGFQKLFDTYNGVPDKTGKIPFKFNSIRVVSAGERDPDADDVSGMSASKMRLAAASGNLEAFAQGVPDKRLAKSMYDAVRAGMGVKESLSEDQEITPDLLKRLEQYVDKLFATLGMDVEFTRHFLDRVNDPRNVKQITVQELAMLFKKTYSKWGKKIARLGPDAQAVIKDMSTDINMPFVLNWDPRNQELDLVAKTVMRKKNFTTPNQEFPVENFADGKKPGRKGLSKRMGVNTKASVSSLRKTAKNSSGEKQRMAHWLANMKAGRAKKKLESLVEDDDEIYYSKRLAPVVKKLFQAKYPEAKVVAQEDGDGYLTIKTTDGIFGFSIGASHQYGDNIISVGNAYAGSYRGIVGNLVKAAVELLKKKHPDSETTLVAQHDVSDNYWPQLASKLGIEYENNEW